MTGIARQSTRTSQTGSGSGHAPPCFGGGVGSRAVNRLFDHVPVDGTTRGDILAAAGKLGLEPGAVNSAADLERHGVQLHQTECRLRRDDMGHLHGAGHQLGWCFSHSGTGTARTRRRSTRRRCQNTSSSCRTLASAWLVERLARVPSRAGLSGEWSPMQVRAEAGRAAQIPMAMANRDGNPSTVNWAHGWRVKCAHRARRGPGCAVSFWLRRRSALGKDGLDLRRSCLLIQSQRDDFGWCQHAGCGRGSELRIR